MSYLDMPDGTRMDIFGQGGGEAMAKSYKVPFLGAIPIDPEVRVGGDFGKPIVYSQPETKAARILVEITKKLAAQISIAAFATVEATS
jgi:ATP-binding protein involved in chromosome partitioning